MDLFSSKRAGRPDMKIQKVLATATAADAAFLWHTSPRSE